MTAMNKKKSYMRPSTRSEMACAAAMIAESIRVGGHTDATEPVEVKASRDPWDIWGD